MARLENLHSTLAKDDIFVEKWQDKGEDLWVSRSSKLWKGKYTWMLIKDKGNFVNFS